MKLIKLISFVLTFQLLNLSSAASPNTQNFRAKVYQIFEGLPVLEPSTDNAPEYKDLTALFILEPNGKGEVNGHPVTLADGQTFTMGQIVQLQVSPRGTAMVLPQVGARIEYTNFSFEIYRISTRILSVYLVKNQTNETPTDTHKKPTSILDDPNALNALSSLIVDHGYEISQFLPQETTTLVILRRR